MQETNVLVYGAYGYTGRLIVEELLAHDIQPILAGRNPEKMAKYGQEKALEFTVFDLSEKDKLVQWLQRGNIVIHCGGPFIHTAEVMVEACLLTNTHYLDITGEYQVFDLLQTYSQVAKKIGIMVLPGAGFDVVPSDCLAASLKEDFPEGDDLQLAFVSKGGRMSRGTTKTMIEGMGSLSMRRKDGQYVGLPLGRSTLKVDFGAFEQLTMSISWGDISTAFYSTGIPNIEVFTGSSEKQIARLRKMKFFSWLLKKEFVKNFFKKKVDKKPDGPSQERRIKSDTLLWGKISKGDKSVERRLKVPNGYTLTAQTAVLIARKIKEGNLKPGFQTPSSAYGNNLILEVEGCEYY